jgi:aminopeptidase N
MSKIKPNHYKIHLEPDLNRFTFDGRAEIYLEASEATKAVSLNVLELALWRCQVLAGAELKDCGFAVDPQKELVTISLPEEAQGDIALSISFVGVINNKMAGFYRSRYAAEGEERFIAVTQFEESDARRAFPCMDHPSFKATFDVEMVIDADKVAVSNMPIGEEKDLGKGRKLVRFEPTPRMSTYLLFFGVGDFRFIQDPGEVLIRVATMPGVTHQGQFGLDFSRKALVFAEDYFGTKYPLPKLDLLAIADFAAGAMENWGAMTFRENLLLHDPETTSKAGEERICEVIAHELAHQWFGDLVTPEDWKYLWLNESFATYFGYGIVDHYYPEWDVWEQFLQGQTGTALDRDALQENFPIEIPSGDHVIINVSTAPIIYNKGGSILRQVEGYLGPDYFRDGLRRYLKTHEYGCASSHDLWEALESVSAKPVARIMENWIGQAGLPLLEIKREKENLLITQKRFTYLPGQFDQSWLIPLSVRTFLKDGTTKVIEALVEGDAATVPIEGDVASYKVNDGQTGFYRVRYLDEENLKELGKRIAGKSLGPVDRWGLQTDFYALVKAGTANIEDYLGILAYYADEDAFLPLTSIATNMHHAYVITGDEKLASLGAAHFERVLKRVGYDPTERDKHTTSILREQLLWHAALYGSRKAGGFGESRFSSAMEGRRIHPDIMRSVMQVGAFLGGEDAYHWLTKRFQSSSSEHERMNILVALGCFNQKTILDKVLSFVLEEVPDRNKFIPIGVLAENRLALPQLWEWFLENQKRIEEFHPIHYERVVAALIPYSGLGRESEVREFFENYMKKTDKAKDVIKLSLEKLEIHSRMRKAFLAGC